MKVKCIITLFGQGGGDQFAALLALPDTAAPCYCEPGTEIFKLAPGLLLQICGTSVPKPSYLTDSNFPLISFGVANVNASIADAQALGATLLDKHTDPQTGFVTCHLRMANGRVIGLFS